MNDKSSFLSKNSHTNKLKIELQVCMVDTNRSTKIGFRILNPYRNNILRVKYLKFLSEKKIYFFLSIIYMTEVKKYKLNNEEFNYDKKLYIKKNSRKNYW